ncbi:MAG: [LysW]-lysine hydrolase [Anaerolineales bacterium]
MTSSQFPAGVETLSGLLEHYSPTGEEAPAVGWLVDRMRLLGFPHASIDEAGNAVGVVGEGPRQLVLLGHIDTVRGEIEVHRQGELLHGRGAVDAKGPLAALVEAVRCVGPVPGWQWVVIGAVDEEGDSRGARFVAERYRPDFVIVGEPSGWDRLTLGYKGSAWTTITVRRPRMHSSVPQASACEAAVAAWQGVLHRADDFNRGRRRVFDQVTPTLRGWSSGEGDTHAWATLELGVRLPEDLPPEAWLDMLLQPAETVEIRIKGFAVPAYRGEKNSVLSRAFLHSIRGAGGTPSFVRKTGTADLNIVAPRWSCPGVAYGPGDSNLDHTPHEHIRLSDFHRACKVLTTVLGLLGSQPPAERAPQREGATSRDRTSIQGRPGA